MSDQLDDFDDAPAGRVEPHRGVLILVLGILGLMMSCGVLSIIAWIMGKRDLGLIQRGYMDKEGEALTKVGYILGIVGTILFMIVLLFIAAYIVIVAAVIASK